MLDVEDMVAMNARELKTEEAFDTLMPRRADVLARITASMRAHGFDTAQPIVGWRERGIVVDGHTRRLAAIEARVPVMVAWRDFASEDEAFDYAVRNQRDRRNMSDSELVALVGAVDKRKAKGGDHGNQYTGGKVAMGASQPIANQAEEPPPVRSAEITADLVGTSADKVKKIRVLKDYAESTGDSEDLDAVKEGKVSINAAARAVKLKKEKVKREQPTPVNVGKPPAPVVCKTTQWTEKQIAYLGSLPLSRKVQPNQFEADALALLAVGPLLAQLKDAIRDAVGAQAAHLCGPLLRRLLAIVSTPPVAAWEACDPCKGAGRVELKTCRKCGGAGYQIRFEEN